MAAGNPPIQKTSLRTRAMLIILAAVFAVLGVAGVVVVRQNTQAILDQSVEVSERVADILSQDFVRLLSLNQPETATDLTAKLQSFEQIQQAVLFDSRNSAVFEYSRNNGPVPTLVVPAPGVRHHDGNFTIAKPVVWKNNNYGLIYLQISDHGLSENLSRYYQLLFTLLPVLLLVALMVAAVLQKSFTGPIMRLRDTVNRISRDPDDTRRIEPEGPPEMAELYDGLNNMLDRIHEIQDSLCSEKDRLQITFHSIGDGVICTDGEGRIEYTNPEADRLMGYRSRELKNRLLSEVFKAFKEFNPDEPVDPVTRCLWEGRVIGAEHSTLMINRHNEEIPISTSAAPIWDKDGGILGCVFVIRDVADARKMARELSHQAAHDSLTGLINRRELENRLEGALSSAQGNNAEHVLLYLDLDQFKVVNDTCGHMAGDELLKQLAVLLSDSVRRGDTLSRLGGDEFGILLENCALKPAQDIAEMLRQAVKGFRFVWEGNAFDVGVSIGMVSITRDSETVNRLLSEADMACYAAKDAGRNRVSLYRADDEEARQRYGEMQWVSRINRALEDQRFVLYQQTIQAVNPDLDQGEHYEILIRMIDDDGKIIAPGAFLPAAERYNLSPALDRWVISNTLSRLSANPDKLQRLELCSINISGETMGDDHFLDFVVAQIRDSGVPPEKICFEITETAAIANLTSARTFISKLKSLGCRFALDDFGAGMSSFGYLKNLDVDYLKIDGMFVKDIVFDPIDFAMVKSINEIGHVMGKKTIAEFVEDESILQRLSSIGVDFAQGYGVAVPRPFMDTEEPTDSSKLDKAG